MTNYVTSGRPFTVYHTDENCERLTSMTKHVYEKSDSFVEWHDLDKCEWCETNAAEVTTKNAVE